RLLPRAAERGPLVAAPDGGSGAGGVPRSPGRQAVHPPQPFRHRRLAPAAFVTPLRRTLGVDKRRGPTNIRMENRPEDQARPRRGSMRVHLTTEQKGQIALAKVLIEAAKKGAEVYLLTAPSRCDLLLDWEGRFSIGRR